MRKACMVHIRQEPRSTPDLSLHQMKDNVLQALLQIFLSNHLCPLQATRLLRLSNG